MIGILIGVSIFGFLGLSILCPLLAFPVYYFQRKTKEKKGSSLGSSPLSSIEIMIPAHNEAAVIGATVASIDRSIQYVQTTPTYLPLPQIRIHVGADQCTDATATIARQYSKVSVTEFPHNGSKWQTLKALCLASSADWIIFVDAGAIWPEHFLSDVISPMREHHLMALAPAYRPWRTTWLHHWIWSIEMALKKMETHCGGPVSVHGATVCYRAAALKSVFSWLGETSWLNDDVVIPLILHALYPEGLIRYPVSVIRDMGVRTGALDFRRRKRILFGNLQWIMTLLPYCFRHNPSSAMVAVRRLFRVLWAYWFVLIGVGLALAFHLVVPALVTLGLLMIFSGSARELGSAALVSLEAPFYATPLNTSWQSAWK